MKGSTLRTFLSDFGNDGQKPGAYHCKEDVDDVYNQDVTNLHILMSKNNVFCTLSVSQTQYALQREEPLT